MRALDGDATTAGQGWDTALSPSMGGVLTQTVSYTDSSGTRWLFPYYGNTGGSGPYSQYDIPPGQPWSLSTSPITGYSLANILTGETLTFDAQGRLQATTDAYGNQNAVTAGTNQPTSLTNSGGRSLAVSYGGNGLLADAQSPLWQSQGANAAGSQHVTYGYNPQGQLTTLTRGAGTTDALTATFGYSGAELVTVTTPYTQSQHTWQLGYDPQGRVTALTSPGQGQQGQAGYTPAYTTQFTYGVSQTVVVEGVGTSGALTHTYTLDAQGNAPQLTDVSGQGHVRTATFDVDHDVISGTDALGHTTLYTHTYVGPTGNVGLLTQEQQPAISANTIGNGLTPVSTTYAYDPVTFDRLREDKPAGGEVYYTYDGHHAVATTVELVTSPSSCGSSSSVALKPAALTPNGVCQSTPTWRGSVNQYDPYGELIATTDGRGTDITDTAGQTPTTGLDTVFGPLYTSHDAYDAQGDQTASGTPPITTTLPSGQPQVSTPVTTTTGYDADGNPISTTSANGNASTTSYDHLGRVVQTTDPPVQLWDNTSASPTTLTRYDGDGDTVYTQDPNGAVTTSQYDPLGRLVATTNPVSGTQLITYTATRQSAAQDEQGNVTHYSYSTTGELIRVDDPVSGTVQYGYDAGGQTIAITSGASAGPPAQLETRGYDGLGQLITDTVGGVGAMTQTTLTAYDLDGNVAEVQHPDGNVTLNNYDFADELTDVTLTRLGSGPFTLQDHYDYDAAGNQTADHDAASFEHVQAYDAANHALQELDRTYQQAGTETITTTRGVDPDGNIITQTVQEQQPSPQTHTDAYGYNADDLLTSKVQDGVRTTYGYDAAGQQRSQTVYDGSVPVTTQRDAAGRTTAIGESASSASPYTSTFGYNADSQPTTVTVPGGVQELAQYDQGSRLTNVAATGPATATNPLNSSYAYSYTATSWTSVETDTVNTINGGQSVVRTYGHDPLGRLTSVQGPNGTLSYGYDGNGNLTAITTSAGTTTYAYNGSAANELTNVIAPGQPITSYNYDGQGDTTSITDTAGSNVALSYDKQERLVGVTLTDGTRVSMAYNAQGQRASYAVTPPGQGTPSLSEAFTYREDELGQAVVTGTSVTTPYTDTYLYDPIGNPLELLRQQGGTTSRYWYVLDGRGNVVALTDGSGNVVDRYGYDAWGLPMSISEMVPQPFRYAGYWYDKELGWYWVSVREYAPQIARWLQPDPSEQEGIRTYVYVGDDPIDFSDPSGLDAAPTPTPTPVAGGNVPEPCSAYTSHTVCEQPGYINQEGPIAHFIDVTLSDPENQQLFIMMLTDGIIGAALGPADSTPDEDTVEGRATEPAPPSAGGARSFGSGRAPHTAEVTVTNSRGEVVARQTLTSGNMTAEEAKLGFPRSSLATHTEARAVRQIPLKRGDTMVIRGQYPPCPSCKGAMNQAARGSNATIIYEWGGNRWVAKP